MDLSILQLLFIVHNFQLILVNTARVNICLIDYAIVSQRLKISVIRTNEFRIDGPVSDCSLSTIDLALLLFFIIDHNWILKALISTTIIIEFDELPVFNAWFKSFNLHRG